MSDLWPALWLSLRIATVATAITMLLGVPLAYVTARRRFPGRSVLEALILTPLVLPPTVVGYLIIVTLGARGWLGGWIDALAGYSVMFRFEGAVLAAATVALPLQYMPARAAFASVDRELEDMARTLGAGRLRSFWHVSLPLARRGGLGGAILAFARALGEFGATVMVFGWQPDRLTLPVSVYADFELNRLAHAAPAVAAMSLISLALMMAFNASAAGKRD